METGRGPDGKDAQKRQQIEHIDRHLPRAGGFDADDEENGEEREHEGRDVGQKCHRRLQNW